MSMVLRHIPDAENGQAHLKMWVFVCRALLLPDAGCLMPAPRVNASTGLHSPASHPTNHTPAVDDLPLSIRVPRPSPKTPRCLGLLQKYMRKFASMLHNAFGYTMHALALCLRYQQHAQRIALPHISQLKHLFELRAHMLSANCKLVADPAALRRRRLECDCSTVLAKCLEPWRDPCPGPHAAPEWWIYERLRPQTQEASMKRTGWPATWPRFDTVGTASRIRVLFVASMILLLVERMCRRSGATSAPSLKLCSCLVTCSYRECSHGAMHAGPAALAKQLASGACVADVIS